MSFTFFVPFPMIPQVVDQPNTQWLKQIPVSNPSFISQIQYCQEPVTNSEAVAHTESKKDSEPAAVKRLGLKLKAGGVHTISPYMPKPVTDGKTNEGQASSLKKNEKSLLFKSLCSSSSPSSDLPERNTDEKSNKMTNNVFAQKEREELLLKASCAPSPSSHLSNTDEDMSKATNNASVQKEREISSLKAGSASPHFPSLPMSWLKPSTKVENKPIATFVLEDKEELNFKNELILSHKDFQEQLVQRLVRKLTVDMIIKKAQDCTSILFLNFDSRPQVLKSIIIYNDMSLKIFSKDNIIDISFYKHLLADNKLYFWDQLEDIFDFVNEDVPEEDTNIINYEKALHHWGLYAKSGNQDSYNCKDFLLEQMRLCSKPGIPQTFSGYLYNFAYCLYMKSSACYRTIYKSKLIKIPSIKHLKDKFKLTNIE